MHHPTETEKKIAEIADYARWGVRFLALIAGMLMALALK